MKKKIISTGAIGYIMHKRNSVDIDNEMDFKIAELLIERKIKNES